MSERREQLERLLTEATDTPMSDADARRYGRLARMLSDWRTLDAGVDWAALAGKVSARIRDEVESQASARVDQLIDPAILVEDTAPGVDRAARGYRAVDDLLNSAAPALPPVDWNALSARISAAVMREAQAAPRESTPRAGGRRNLHWVIRIGAPLAAAAVIALAIWGTRSVVQTAGTSTEPGKSTIKFAFEEPGAQDGRISITFDESRPKGAMEQDGASTSSGYASGSPGREAIEPPIDPAMLP